MIPIANSLHVFPSFQLSRKWIVLPGTKTLKDVEIDGGVPQERFAPNHIDIFSRAI